MQIGQFVLPRHGYPVTNDTEVARYLRTTKEQLPVAHVRPFTCYQGAFMTGTCASGSHPSTTVMNVREGKTDISIMYTML